MSLLFAEEIYMIPVEYSFRPRNQLTNYQTFSYFPWVFISSSLRIQNCQVPKSHFQRGKTKAKPS